MVSPRPRPDGWWHPDPPFFFVDDVTQAVAKAKQLAGRSVDTQHVLEDPHVVVQGDRVVHVRERGCAAERSSREHPAEID